MIYTNANSAFCDLYKKIVDTGEKVQDTKALFNYGFYLDNPADNYIKADFRKWSLKYAKAEWQWYLSETPYVFKLKELYGKSVKIWENICDEDGRVNSNYGHEWSRNGQLDYVIDELKANPESRRAALSIYDAKNRHNFEKDTPCTYAIQFTVIADKLCMTVLMRSNDLWYGFCNDQYCFSELQKYVAKQLNLELGWYYHHATNLHLYERNIQ